MPLGSDQNGVMARFDEIRAKKLLDCLTVDLLRPGPVEVDHGFCSADVRVAHAPLEPAFLALALLDGEYFVKPGLVDDLVAAGDQPEQSQSFEARLQFGRRKFSGH